MHRPEHPTWRRIGRRAANIHIHRDLFQRSRQKWPDDLATATEGLVWPDRAAHGVAVVGEANAVTGGWGSGPAVSARVLGPDGDGSYETFRVERIRTPRHPHDHGTNGKWFGYCKTNYRPFDLCVQCCLIVLNHHLGTKSFRVGSDGSSHDWNDARDACQHVLGYGIDWGEDRLAPLPPSPPPTPPSSETGT